MTALPSRDSDIAIVITDTADQEARAAVATPLRAFNDQRAGSPAMRPLNVLLKDGAGKVVGGLWGQTYWRWLYVELLFVPDELRGRDTGAQLLRAAEAEARSRGCIGAWLDTFSFQAPGFYERQGYSCFGKLNDFPPGHSRLYFAKPL